MTAKERIYEIMDALPDDVTFEDALYETVCDIQNRAQPGAGG